MDLWADAGGHGTHVTGTIAGSGYLAPRFAGMAPSVRAIRFAKVFHHDYRTQYVGCGRPTRYSAPWTTWPRPPAATARAPVQPRIVNMSLSDRSTEWAGRDVGARKLDATVWAHRQLYVVAQANVGEEGFSNYAGAKNSLAVGAVYDDGHVATFSSHGPTYDGRLAPQVVGTGVGVCSAEGNGKGAGYVCNQGTSMAAPSVAGVAALLLDANPGYRAQPALVRARLMASAIRPDAWLEAEAAFPSTNSDGPGTLQAEYGMGKVSARLAVLDRDRTDGWRGGGAAAEINSEDEYSYVDVEVPEDSTRLDVVLTWDEPPSEAIATPVLNDLDLWVDAGGDCADGACGEHASTSRIDNVEWIVVRDPDPGTYRIKVVPRRIYTGAPQAGVAWTVVRGASTPTLALAVDETPLGDAGDVRHLELKLEVTADAYVAAGVRVHLECRGDGTDCDALTVGLANIEREDGTAGEAGTLVWEDGHRRHRNMRPVAMASRISLGEISVDETQEVTFDVAYSGAGPVHLYLAASSWNGQGASHVVAVQPPGGDEDIDPLAVPGNDRFRDAEPLVAAEGSLTVDPVGSTSESGEPAFDANLGRPLGSLWYKWTAPSTDLVRFGATASTGSSTTAHLDVYRGENIAGLDHIAANRKRELAGYTDYLEPIWRTIFTDAVFFAEVGEAFRIRLAHDGPAEALLMRWRQGPRPENDDLANAETLTGKAGRTDATSLGATLETGESIGPFGATTWYRWTAPEDDSWRFHVDSNHVARVAVFTGGDVRELRLVSGFPTDTATFNARQGDEYRIAVAAGDGELSTGPYRLSWDQVHWTPPAQDRFGDARRLDPLSSGFFSLPSALTVEPGEPAASGVRTRWWSWIAPATGRFTLKLDSGRTELTVAAYTGDALDGLQVVGSTGDVVTKREFSFAAELGQRYWLSVGWPAGDYGAYASASAFGYLNVDATPVNDEFDGATALGSTRGLIPGSNAYATTGAGERADQLGHSSLWWKYETPTPGWYEFRTRARSTALAVYEVDEQGVLREISRDSDGTVVFLAEVGKRYAIRAGTFDGNGGWITLYWRPVGAPAWLRFVGSYTDAADEDGDALRLVDLGSLAFDAHALYAVSPFGLAVFEQDPETGALGAGRSIDDDLAGSILVHDAIRNRLIANRCGTWRVYTGLDGPVADIEGVDLAVEGDPANCGRRLFFAPGGAFLYRAVPDEGIDVFAVDGDGLRHVETTQLSGLKDAIIAPSGGFVYATHLDTTSHIRTFRRDQDNGVLSKVGDDWYFYTLADMDTLTMADDERLFVAQGSTGFTGMYSMLDGAIDDWAGHVSIAPERELSAQLARPFDYVSARRGASAVDVFGSSVAAGVEVEQEEIDLLANGQSDRFGNRVPLFGAPNGLASGPDGRHLYVATYEHGIVAFERVGAGVEPVDPHELLSILDVSSGTISFASAKDSDDCIAVTDLAHDGVTYTVTSSKWQHRPNADWPWSDLADTVATGELCPHTPSDPGHYRLVVEMKVDGATRWHTSKVLVEDDHGDSVDQATTIALPSVTPGWLDPDDEDFFRIELEQSGQLTIHSEGWIDAEGRLLDGEGDLIVSDSDSAADFNFRMIRDLDAGTYFVEVQEYSSRPGAYTVHASFEAWMPDLVVDASVSARPAVGETFTLTAGVKNAGNGDAVGTTLRYYRSEDAVISGTDDEIGTEAVAPLAKGESSEYSIEVTVNDAGSYSYGACVDAVEGEADATDNCSPAVTDPPTVFDLDAQNSHPAGIAYADGLLYVVDWIDDKVYAYTTAGQRRASFDFELAEETHWAQSITYANGLLYVGVHDSSSPDKVYAYTVSGEHRPDSDFDLEFREPYWPSGITHANGLFYIADQITRDVFVYSTSGERQSGADFELDRDNSEPLGIAHAEGRLYVVDEYDDNIYAYTTSGVRERDREFDLDVDNNSPEGAAYATGWFYVVDGDSDRVFVYQGNE